MTKQNIKKTDCKKLSLLAVVLLLAVGLMAGCGTPTAPGETDGSAVTDPGLAPAEMLDKVMATTPDIKDSLMDLTQEQINEFFSFTEDVKFEGAVKISSMNVKANEVGIFKATDENQLTGIKMAIDNRINSAIAGWMPGYMPEEITKMENATIENKGNYYIYVIADEAEKTEILKAFNELFK